MNAVGGDEDIALGILAGGQVNRNLVAGLGLTRNRRASLNRVRA